MSKVVRKTIRMNTEWWNELSKRVQNVSEYIRDAVNEKQAREGHPPLPGEVGQQGVRHYEERKG